MEQCCQWQEQAAIKSCGSHLQGGLASGKPPAPLPPSGASPSLRGGGGGESPPGAWQGLKQCEKSCWRSVNELVLLLLDKRWGLYILFYFLNQTLFCRGASGSQRS